MRDCVQTSRTFYVERCCDIVALRRLRALPLLCSLLLVVSAVGCASIRNRIAHRSDECKQLCEEARQAREQGLDREADQLLSAAIKRRPTETQARLDVAEELWSSGRQIAAANILAQMLSERPDDAPVALRLARMEFEIGRIAAAEAALRIALLNDPLHPEGLRLKAEIADQRGDFETSLATYHQLTQILPDDVEAQLAIASIHLRRGQPDRASPLLRQVVHGSQPTLPQRRRAEWQLGISYAQAERWPEAAASLQHALEGTSGTAEQWYQVAYAQARCGEQERAFNSIDRALRTEPQHAGAIELARHLRMGDDQSLTGVVPAGFTEHTTSQTAAGPPTLNNRRARL